MRFFACSNSETVSNCNIEIVADNNAREEPSTSSEYAPNAKNTEDFSSSKILDYLPLDDTEYPYAGIPRIVIETENHRAIKDRETEILAKLQIWGQKAPESEIMELTIRGRGNSSWDSPKKIYKIEFIDKQTILGMPKDRDWALISNYADKTLIKNYLMYPLSAKMEAYYTPRCEFVELYINKEYLGVYLLTETIKISKNRINIPNNDNSYIVEFDGKYHKGEQVVFSNVIKNDSIGKPVNNRDIFTHTLEDIDSIYTILHDAAKKIISKNGTFYKVRNTSIIGTHTAPIKKQSKI